MLRRMVSSNGEWGSERTIRHSLIATGRNPEIPGKCLKTLKTARASYWLELAWFWDRRDVH